MHEMWNNQTAYLQDHRKQLLKQIKELKDKLSYIRNLLSSKQIELEDFREMKSDYSGKVEKLEAKLTACNNYNVNIKGLLDIGLIIC